MANNNNKKSNNNEEHDDASQNETNVCKCSKANRQKHKQKDREGGKNAKRKKLYFVQVSVKMNKCECLHEHVF